MSDPREVERRPRERRHGGHSALLWSRGQGGLHRVRCAVRAGRGLLVSGEGRGVKCGLSSRAMQPFSTSSRVLKGLPRKG